MSAVSAKIYVAIVDDGGFFKHWAFFIDGPQQEHKTILQALGSSGRFRFDHQIEDARQYPTLIELFYVSQIDATKMDDVKHIAEKVPIRDNIPSWNCQDYVLDLLKVLEEEGIIDNDDEYQARRSTLWHKQDGLS